MIQKNIPASALAGMFYKKSFLDFAEIRKRSRKLCFLSFNRLYVSRFIC